MHQINKMKNGVKLTLLLSTYNNICKKVAVRLYEISHELSYMMKCYGDDILGSFALSAIYKEILQSFNIKFSSILGGIASFSILSSLELMQKYNLMSGWYDENDFKAYAAGASLYLIYRSLYKKKK